MIRATEKRVSRLSLRALQSTREGDGNTIVGHVYVFKHGSGKEYNSAPTRTIIISPQPLFQALSCQIGNNVTIWLLSHHFSALFWTLTSNCEARKTIDNKCEQR